MPEVVFEKRGHAGVITLDRQKAFNALNLEMCVLMHDALDDFATDNSISHVVVRSSQNGRFFCAGGDIRSMQAELNAGQFETAEHFFKTEYRLNYKIARYKKPYIALIDGVVMGGGVGISAHGSHRVVSENTIFAMPEVAIGFFPDVGVSSVLAALENNIGAYLAITGERIKAADMLSLGLATHYIPAFAFDEVLNTLAVSDDANAVLANYAQPLANGELQKSLGKISNYFAAQNMQNLIAHLSDNVSDPFAQQVLDTIFKRSPTSMAVALQQLRGPLLSIEDTLRQDFRIASRLMRQKDFPEGVRALLIDKDNAPQWQPATIDDIDIDDIDTIFAPLAAGHELVLS